MLIVKNITTDMLHVDNELYHSLCSYMSEEAAQSVCHYPDQVCMLLTKWKHDRDTLLTLSQDSTT